MSNCAIAASKSKAATHAQMPEMQLHAASREEMKLSR